MGKKVNIIGNKYGNLTVVSFAGIKGKNSYYLCKCDCGNEETIQRSHLTSGDKTHCGCGKSEDGRSKRLIDLIGKRFGRLVVIGRDENDKYHKPRWLCKCDCGKETVVSGAVLRRGDTQSCGCLVKDTFTKHGMYKSRLHKEWRGMKHRCKNPSASHYEYYGGKGIRVCEEWQGEHGFTNFMKWALANGYDDSLSVDRIDNDADYKPSNCRWITMQRQCQNRGVRSTNTSGVTGVHPRTDGGVVKWRATIRADGKNISLGSFADAQDAIKARKEAELKYWG